MNPFAKLLYAVSVTGTGSGQRGVDIWGEVIKLLQERWNKIDSNECYEQLADPYLEPDDYKNPF